MVLDDKVRDEQLAEADRDEHLSYQNVQNGRYRTNSIKRLKEVVDTAECDEHRKMILCQLLLSVTAELMSEMNISTMEVDEVELCIKAFLLEVAKDEGKL